MGLSTVLRRRRRLFWVLACFLLVFCLVIYFRGKLWSKDTGKQRHDSATAKQTGRGGALGGGRGGGGGTRGSGNKNVPHDRLEDDFHRLDVALAGDHISYDNVVQFKLGEELLSETEKEAMRTEISPDFDTEPSRETSTLHLVPSDEADSGHNNITVRLDLRDGKGRQVRYGGHQVRMWITSVPPDKKAAALRVTDLRNGSYVSSFPALWPSETVVHAELIFSRDLHYAMSKTTVNMKNPQPLVGGFVRGDCKQATLCGPVPVIPGYPASCNHTSMNFGLGWYCGKPTGSCLSCEDLKFARRFKIRGFPRPEQSEAEQSLYNWNIATMTALKWKFDIKQTLTVLSHTRPPPKPRVPCSEMKPRDTWTMQSPHGYLENETWHSLICEPLPWKYKSAKDCFRGATFWFLGDSNARMLFQSLCTLASGSIDLAVLKGHIPLFCKNINRHQNMTVAWYPHEYPFQGATNVWYDMSLKKSPRYYMDKIPPTGKYFVLVHLLAHFANYPTAVYAEHVRDVARGARDLCRRNPSAKIVIRGPTCWANQFRGDYVSTMSRDVLIREFRELRDCVLFMDAYDITLVAGGCLDVHPPMFATEELTRIFLGHVCHGSAVEKEKKSEGTPRSLSRTSNNTAHTHPYHSHH